MLTLPVTRSKDENLLLTRCSYSTIMTNFPHMSRACSFNYLHHCIAVDAISVTFTLPNTTNNTTLSRPTDTKWNLISLALWGPQHSTNTDWLMLAPVRLEEDRNALALKEKLLNLKISKITALDAKVLITWWNNQYRSCMVNMNTLLSSVKNWMNYWIENLWSCDNNGTRDVCWAEKVNGGEMFIRGAWWSVDNKVVQFTPVHILQECLNHLWTIQQ